MTANSVERYDTEPFLMTVLSQKFEMVTRDITQSLLKSARSGVINVARDFSSAITLGDGRQIMIDEGLPVHLGNIGLIPQHTQTTREEISPGDCFLTNSPWHGNSHHADYTIHAPVFYEDELLFWSINKAHQADIGAPQPTTYLPEAENVFQEGPQFPAVKIQEDYEDIDDWVRFLKHNVRLGEEQWYGDYQAQVAAVRTGEKRIKSIIDQYGVDVVKRFVNDWLDYGEEMMKNEIASLPEEELSHTSYHDQVPGVSHDVPIRVDIKIRPEQERIHADVTENIENIQGGCNLTEATTAAGVYAGIFNNLDTELPHNEGALRRIDIEMDQGKIVGKPDYPIGTSVATTNFFDVLYNAVQASFGQLGEPFGIAEANPSQPPHAGVISGTDARKNDQQYVNQIIYTSAGGPATHGHDGWQTYGLPAGAGVLQLDSIEIDEKKFPIMFDRHEIVPDTEGAGKWRGAPGTELVFGPRFDPMTVAYTGNAKDNPPQGILGGKKAHPASVTLLGNDGSEKDMPVLGVTDLSESEKIASHHPGGGGYGDPYERDPQRVLDDIKEGYITKDRAERVYGVAVENKDGEVTIDNKKTNELRLESETGGES